MSVAPIATPAGGTVTQADFLRVSVPLVAAFEGKRNEAYLDRIASPPVWTICFGETRGVQQGDVRTDAECSAMLGVALVDFRNGLHKYFTPETVDGRLTPERDAAYVSLSYNVGVGGAGKSTAVRRLNAGDIRGGCVALGWFNKAGGRIIRGLANRRAKETALCLAGL